MMVGHWAMIYSFDETYLSGWNNELLSMFSGSVINGRNAAPPSIGEMMNLTADHTAMLWNGVISESRPDTRTRKPLAQISNSPLNCACNKRIIQILSAKIFRMQKIWIYQYQNERMHSGMNFFLINQQFIGKKIQNKKLFGLLNIFSALNNLTSALSSCYIKYFSKIVLCTIFRLWSIIKTMEQCRNQHEFIRNYIMLVWQLPEWRLWQQSASLTFALNQRCGQQQCDWTWMSSENLTNGDIYRRMIRNWVASVILPQHQCFVRTRSFAVCVWIQRTSI